MIPSPCPPNCSRCLEISRITNDRDRKLAGWSHSAYEQAVKEAEAEGAILDRLSEDRHSIKDTYRVIGKDGETISAGTLDNEPFLLRRGTDGLSVPHRPKPSVFCQVLDSVVLVGVGIVIGMAFMYYFVL